MADLFLLLTVNGIWGKEEADGRTSAVNIQDYVGKFDSGVVYNVRAPGGHSFKGKKEL